MTEASSATPVWLRTSVRRRSYWSLALGAFIFIILIRWLSIGSHPTSISTQPSSHDCRQLPGADDVLVVLKTGATVLEKKLPIHFSTTFRCTPNYTIFSDLDEVFQGHVIHDSLDEVNPQIIKNNPDFKLYRELQTRKGTNRDEWELKDTVELHEAARVLDKYKFLPLMAKTLRTAPNNSKWFFFIEADTALVWPNLLLWLANLNSKRSLYLGNQASGADHAFAHGGSGVLVSRGALEEVVNSTVSRRAEYDKMTRAEAWGDLVLARAFEDVGVNLVQSWPSIQGETPFSLDYTDHHWCFPVVTYHHMDAQAIQQVWELTQNWTTLQPPGRPLLHRDVFELLIQPKLFGISQNWDNLSLDWDEDPLTVDSVEICRDTCKSMQNCVQYSFRQMKKLCHLSRIIRYGKRVPGIQSGWMLERINARKAKWGPCKEKWIRPPRPQ